MLEGYKDIMSIGDLQKVLGIGRNAAYDILNDGTIKAFKIGRNWKIPKQSVINLILNGPPEKAEEPKENKPQPMITFHRPPKKK